MDEKSHVAEAEPKITRSRARHIRRKRMISARREAENRVVGEEGKGSESSGIVKIEKIVKTGKTPENRKPEGSSSKSKARRLRKKKYKIERGKSPEVKNSETRIDAADSPSGSGENHSEHTAASSRRISSRERKIWDEFSDRFYRSLGTSPNRNELEKRVEITASEHERYENEKNCRSRENPESSLESPKGENDKNASERTTRDSRSAKFPGLVIPTGDITNVPEKMEDLRVKSTNLTKHCGTVDSQERDKTREEIKAEREARKAAKAAKAAKGTTNRSKDNVAKLDKAERASEEIVTETRGDVVDGEILSKSGKLAEAAPICTKKPERGEPLSACVQSTNETKSKSALRAERRAKQEAQRAAKQMSQLSETTAPKAKVIVDSRIKTSAEFASIEKEDVGKKFVTATVTKSTREINLFKHLYHEREQARVNSPIVNSNIHPAIVRLGVQYAHKIIVGSNARCVALLAAIKELVQDFERPSQADFTRGLEASLQQSSTYLHHCRPLAVSMQNALRHLKWQMAQLSATTCDEAAKTKLANAIDTYIQEQILLADKAISITIQTKITNGDVILTYGYSSLICKILCDAHDAGRLFRVVVVDGRPWLEGREQVRRLAKHGLECCYVLVNALSFIMPEVTKVFLGAHGILANGAVMSRVGTAQVALMAKAFNVPVLVACETHKTCERVQTDSIVYNEIGDADELAKDPIDTAKKTLLTNWRSKKSLNLLNITYDVTPADLVTAVVTELAILPCTSVPVILRIKPSEI